MDQSPATERELAIPAGALRALRKSLREEAGALGATHALHAAGYGTGASLSRLFAGSLETPPGELDVASLWKALDEFFTARGWGGISHEQPHPAVGILSSPDWAEADPDGGERQPSCPFTSGLLASILTELAGDPVAVLEVACRSTGAGACRFAFGSEAAIHELYGLLLEEHSFEEALASL